ncbi:MAG: hypothetical protein H8E54_05300 [Candidatus Aminicenantes bacterium]|nr:hypothetical protein [Candidatus Aminicenantes bacterium]
MEIPDDLYLNAIKESHAYRDKKSLEKSRRRRRPKFKLAGKPLSVLETYSFFLIHSEIYACIRALTLCVKRSDWEKRDPKYLFFLNNKQSFIDINKCEILTKEILLKKIKDKRNKFPYIAKLCNTKYEELKKLAEKLAKIQYQKRISKETKRIIGAAFDVSDELKQKLGL